MNTHLTARRVIVALAFTATLGLGAGLPASAAGISGGIGQNGGQNGGHGTLPPAPAPPLDIYPSPCNPYDPTGTLGSVPAGSNGFVQNPVGDNYYVTCPLEGGGTIQFLPLTGPANAGGPVGNPNV